MKVIQHRLNICLGSCGTFQHFQTFSKVAETSAKSHLKSHSNQFISKQKKYVSKSFDKKYEKKFSYIRPVLKKGQGILFHPNLMHGGSINKGNITRSSIDIRIFNKSNFNPYNSKK